MVGDICHFDHFALPCLAEIVTSKSDQNGLLKNAQKSVFLTMKALEMKGSRSHMNSPLAKKRAMVLDDDPSMRAIMHKILEEQGMVVDEAANIPMAFEKIEKNHPHICIVDLKLQEESGFAFLQKMATIPQFRGIPVLICSASPQKEILLQLATLGIRNFLTKPIRQVDLIGKIKRILKDTGPLSYTFLEEKKPQARIVCEGKLIRLNELHCTISSLIKMPIHTPLELDIPFLREAQIECRFFESLNASLPGATGLYFTKLIIKGVSEKTTAAIRNLQNSWNQNE